MTTMAPPPAAPAQVPPPPPQPSGASRAVAIVAMVLGALVIVSTATFSAIGAAFSGLHDTSYSVDASTADSLDVHLQAGSLQIEYADVPEARLDVKSSISRGQWTLRVDGSRLVVSSPDQNFGWPGFFGVADTAILRLPTTMQHADATIQVAAGSLRASGEFGALNVDLQAGSAEVDGTAADLIAKTSAGRGQFDLSGVQTAKLTLEAGSMSVVLRDEQPTTTTVKVGAGALDLAVPKGSYDVTSNVSAGAFDNRLGSQPGAASTISVDVSAGQVTLEPTD